MRAVEGLFPALAVVNLLWAGIAGPEEGRRYDDLISAMGKGSDWQKWTYRVVGVLSVMAASRVAWLWWTSKESDAAESDAAENVMSILLMLVGVHYAAAAYMMMKKCECECEPEEAKQKGEKSQDPRDALDYSKTPRPIRVMLYMLLAILTIRSLFSSEAAAKAKQVVSKPVQRWKNQRKVSRDVASARKRAADEAEAAVRAQSAKRPRVA